MKKSAFTLAEVLITLVIIGVIGAMTIPTLMNNTNKQEYVSKLKKAYSTLSQATNKIIAEQGNPRADIGGWASSVDAVFDNYKKYLSNSKECGAGIECVNDKWYHLNETPNDGWHKSPNSRRLVLADGMQILFEPVSDSCSISDGNTENNICFRIYVDINGNKNPNKIGRDIFMFLGKETGLYPNGCNDDSDCSTNEYGFSCACKVLREGAMNY